MSYSLSFRSLDQSKGSYYILKLLDSCFKTRRRVEYKCRWKNGFRVSLSCASHQPSIIQPSTRSVRIQRKKSPDSDKNIVRGHTCRLGMLSFKRQLHIQLYALSSIKFQTLFHPLIRVFFNFRSSYLFSIGLPYIFSFGSKILSQIHTSLSTCATHFSSPTYSNNNPFTSEKIEEELKEKSSV